MTEPERLRKIAGVFKTYADDPPISEFTHYSKCNVCTSQTIDGNCLACLRLAAAALERQASIIENNK